MATKIKETQKSRLQELGWAYNRWSSSSQDSLYKAYGRHSEAKDRAWEYCVRLMEDFNGYGLRVVGSNCFQFSAGFIGYEPETNEPVFMYITKSKDWYAPISVIKEAMV